MDLFTHVLFAYLLSFIIWGPAAPQYIAAGALAGGLPDADILLFPLSRRFPSLEHRGIVHSVLGVTIIAAVGAFLVPYLPYFVPASTLLYFVAMEIGGLSHLVLDGFTNYAVTPLAPFSRRILRLDADNAVNITTLGMTAVAFGVLIYEHNRVPLDAWTTTVWILIAVYAGYLLVRVLARRRARLVAAQEGFRAVEPTDSPWTWLMVDQDDSPEQYRIRIRTLNFVSRRSSKEQSMSVAKVPAATGPVSSVQAALDRTYLPAVEKSQWLRYNYHFGEAIEKENAFEVFWYIVHGDRSRRAFGVHGVIDRDTGAIQLRSGFFRLPQSASSQSASG